MTVTGAPGYDEAFRHELDHTKHHRDLEAAANGLVWLTREESIATSLTLPIDVTDPIPDGASYGNQPWADTVDEGYARVFEDDNFVYFFEAGIYQASIAYAYVSDTDVGERITRVEFSDALGLITPFFHIAVPGEFTSTEGFIQATFPPFVIPPADADTPYDQENYCGFGISMWQNSGDPLSIKANAPDPALYLQRVAVFA